MTFVHCPYNSDLPKYSSIIIQHQIDVQHKVVKVPRYFGSKDVALL